MRCYVALVVSPVTSIVHLFSKMSVHLYVISLTNWFRVTWTFKIATLISLLTRLMQLFQSYGSGSVFCTVYIYIIFIYIYVWVCSIECTNKRCGFSGVTGHWSDVGEDVACIDLKFAVRPSLTAALIGHWFPPCGDRFSVDEGVWRRPHTYSTHIYSIYKCTHTHTHSRAGRCELHLLWMFRSAVVLLVQWSPWQPASPLSHCYRKLKEKTHNMWIHTHMHIQIFFLLSTCQSYFSRLPLLVFPSSSHSSSTPPFPLFFTSELCLLVSSTHSLSASSSCWKGGSVGHSLPSLSSSLSRSTCQFP